MRRFAICLCVLLCWLPAASAAGTGVELSRFASAFSDPVYLTHAGDGSGRLFVVEQAGRIRIVRDRQVLSRPFLDIADAVVDGGERGLLSVAFHPRFAESRRFFVNYTTRRRLVLTTVVSEFRASADNPDVADPRERVILTVAQPFDNHNGGQIEFGPDGYLYIGMGDGGAGGDPFGHGQNTDSLLGTMLRIDIDGEHPYAVPADNPFVGRPGADEIWAYGLRNPWRFSFDLKTGRLLTGDVGQNHYEEIDVVVRGGNYGWDIMEGGHCFPPPRARCDPERFIAPIAEYGRSEGISVTGGYVYRGERIPDLQGIYVFGDYGSKRVWGLADAVDGDWQRRPLLEAPEPISSFGQDADGELYVVGHGGTIYRFDPAD